MASRASSVVFDAVIWLGVIVFIVIVATVILAYVRRRMRSSMSHVGPPGFDLAELRRLKDRGRLTGEEYDNLFQTLFPDRE